MGPDPGLDLGLYPRSGTHDIEQMKNKIFPILSYMNKIV